jgi:hypothetical protein
MFKCGSLVSGLTEETPLGQWRPNGWGNWPSAKGVESTVEISSTARVATSLRSPIPCHAWTPERLRGPANTGPSPQQGSLK